MKIKALFLIAMLTVSAAMQAQTERNIIYCCSRGNMTYTQPEPKKESTAKTVGNIIGSVLLAAAGTSSSTTDMPAYADAVKDAIVGAVGCTYRLRVVDGNVTDNIPEGTIPCYIDASISAITATKQINVWTDSNKKTHEDTEYRGNITGTINIKNAQTGAIIYTHTINSSSWADSWFATQDKALGYAISRMKQNIANGLNSAYPLYASIVEGARATKSKEKEVYIDLGEKMGCTVGTHFYVYTVKTVAGKEAKKQIGQLKVTEVMGDDISFCKVQRGGAAIKAAIEAGEALLITSKD